MYPKVYCLLTDAPYILIHFTIIMEEKIARFLEQQAAGNIPCGQPFYVIDGGVNQDGGMSPVKLVTPTEQTVAQAKSELKDNIMKQQPKRRYRRRSKRAPVKRLQKGGAKRRQQQQQQQQRKRGRAGKAAKSKVRRGGGQRGGKKRAIKRRRKQQRRR